MHENRETSEMPAADGYCRTAEGLGRTAGVYVSEESHRGIVAMKHSNQDGTWSGESAEGRRRLKENTLSPDTYPTPSGIARVPRGGECADRVCWPPCIQEKNRMRSGAPVRICAGRAGQPVSLPRSTNDYTL